MQLFVIGQRRSGTSAIAGMLHKLGVPMQEGEVHKSERNPKGFYEDRTFVEISEKILWAINQGWHASRIELNFKDDIKKAIKNRGKFWGVKDVNQIYTHPFFRKFCKKSELKYIFVFRNLLDIAKSLYDWHKDTCGMTFPQAMDDVLKNHIMMMHLIKDNVNNCLLVSFEKTKENPDDFIKAVCDYLEIKPTEEQIKDAKEHIQ